MKHLIIKDRNLRKQLKKHDKKLFLSKFLKKDLTGIKAGRKNNRCIVTGRVRSVSRFFRNSRIVLRNKALFGEYPGVAKSSW